MDFLKLIGLTIPDGKAVSFSIGGTAVWQAKTEQEQLTAPTISLDGDTLTMTATDENTKEFVIFIDGVEMATVSSLISFTIDGTQYQAESSMTWGQWVTSEYNTDGYVVNNNQVQQITHTYVRYVCETPDLLSDEYKVKPSDIIEANHTYGSFKEPI